ncbi:hypothetical protein CsSME_00011790 [Camellia sinensis var. sinensis]
MILIWTSGRQLGLICSEPIRRSTDHHAWSGTPGLQSKQYAQGFLMFLFGTTLFSNRGNMLWVCANFPMLTPDPEVEAILVVLYSHRFEGRCRPRSPGSLGWPCQGILNSSSLGHGAPPDTRFCLRDQLAEPGFSGSASCARRWVIPLRRSLHHLHWTCDPQRVSLKEGEYVTYLHTYLMPPLTGVRTPMRRVADMRSSSHTRAAKIPSTSKASTTRDPPTDLTDWQYGTPYQILLEPPLPDHRYVSVDTPFLTPPRGYVQGLLEVMASLEFLVLRREMILHSYDIPVLSSLLVTPVQPEPSKPSRVAGRGISARGQGRRRAPARCDDESSEEEEDDVTGSGSKGGDDAEEDSDDGGSGSNGGAEGSGAKAAQPKRVKRASQS